MASILEFLKNNGMEILTTNIFGLYLPLLISILFIMFGNKKKIFNKSNILLFAISITGTFLFCNTINVTSHVELNGILIEKSYDQVHLVNIFGILYLLLKSLPVEEMKEINISTLWIYSFFSLWIVDSYQAITTFEQTSIFAKGIGGAGIMDGLLLTPLITILGGILIEKSKKLKEKKEAIA